MAWFVSWSPGSCPPPPLPWRYWGTHLCLEEAHPLHHQQAQCPPLPIFSHSIQITTIGTIWFFFTAVFYCKNLIPQHLPILTSQKFTWWPYKSIFFRLDACLLEQIGSVILSQFLKFYFFRYTVLNCFADPDPGRKYGSGSAKLVNIM